MKRSLDDDFFPGNWELPGGGVNSKETPQESLKREIKEECGLLINVIMHLTTNAFKLGSDIEVSESTFLCEVADENFNVMLSEEHETHQWVALENLESFELSNYIRKVINSSKKALKKK